MTYYCLSLFNKVTIANDRKTQKPNKLKERYVSNVEFRGFTSNPE